MLSCSHSLFKRSVKGKLGRRSGDVLITYSSLPFLWSMERNNKLDKVVCDQKMWKLCQGQRWAELVPPAESSFLPKAAYNSMKLEVQFFSHIRHISVAPWTTYGSCCVGQQGERTFLPPQKVLLDSTFLDISYMCICLWGPLLSYDDD